MPATPDTDRRGITLQNRARSLAVFLRGFGVVVLAIIPFGIAVHILSEACALGMDCFTPQFIVRHQYLFLMQLVSFAAGYGLVRSYWRPGYGWLRCALLRDLPFRGRGSRFFMLVWSLQFLFVGATLTFEHAPIHGFDWLIAVLTACLFAIGSSRMIAALPKRLREIHEVLYLERSGCERLLPRLPSMPTLTRHLLLMSGYRTTLGNRPPPRIC